MKLLVAFLLIAAVCSFVDAGKKPAGKQPAAAAAANGGSDDSPGVQSAPASATKPKTKKSSNKPRDEYDIEFASTCKGGVQFNVLAKTSQNSYDIKESGTYVDSDKREYFVECFKEVVQKKNYEDTAKVSATTLKMCDTEDKTSCRKSYHLSYKGRFEYLVELSPREKGEIDKRLENLQKEVNTLLNEDVKDVMNVLLSENVKVIVKQFEWKRPEAGKTVTTPQAIAISTVEEFQVVYSVPACNGGERVNVIYRNKLNKYVMDLRPSTAFGYEYFVNCFVTALIKDGTGQVVATFEYYRTRTCKTNIVTNKVEGPCEPKDSLRGFKGRDFKKGLPEDKKDRILSLKTQIKKGVRSQLEPIVNDLFDQVKQTAFTSAISLKPRN